MLYDSNNADFRTLKCYRRDAFTDYTIDHNAAPSVPMVSFGELQEMVQNTQREGCSVWNEISGPKLGPVIGVCLIVVAGDDEAYSSDVHGINETLEVLKLQVEAREYVVELTKTYQVPVLFYHVEATTLW